MACVLPSIPSLPSLRSHEFRFLTESTFLDSLGPQWAEPRQQGDLPPYTHPAVQEYPSQLSRLTEARQPVSLPSVSRAAFQDAEQPSSRESKRLRLADPQLRQWAAGNSRAPPISHAELFQSHTDGQGSFPASFPGLWADPPVPLSSAPAYLPPASREPAESASAASTAALQQLHRAVIDPRRKRSASYPDSPFGDPLYVSSREASESLRESLLSESSLEEGLQPAFPTSATTAWGSGPDVSLSALPSRPQRLASPAREIASLSPNVNFNTVEACLDQLQTSHTFPCNLQLSLTPTLWRDFSLPNPLMAHIGVRICEVASEPSFQRSLYNSMNPRVVVRLHATCNSCPFPQYTCLRTILVHSTSPRLKIELDSFT